MRRRLVTMLSALSLVLCLACAGMWVRSGFVQDGMVKHSADGDRPVLISARGNLTLLFTSNSPPGLWRWYSRVLDAPGWDWQWPRYRPHNFIGSIVPVAVFQTVFLPYWFLTLATLVLPGSWLWRWKVKHGHRAGFCHVCGYDVRASPERCPECGTPVPLKEVAK